MTSERYHFIRWAVIACVTVLSAVGACPHIGAQLLDLMESDAADNEYLVTRETLGEHERKLEEKQRLWADRHPEWDSWIRENLPVWSEKALGTQAV